MKIRPGKSHNGFFIWWVRHQSNDRSANAKKLLHQSKATKLLESNRAWPKVKQAWGVRPIMSWPTKSVWCQSGVSAYVQKPLSDSVARKWWEFRECWPKFNAMMPEQNGFIEILMKFIWNYQIEKLVSIGSGNGAVSYRWQVISLTNDG